MSTLRIVFRKACAGRGSRARPRAGEAVARGSDRGTGESPGLQRERPAAHVAVECVAIVRLPSPSSRRLQHSTILTVGNRAEYRFDRFSAPHLLRYLIKYECRFITLLQDFALLRTLHNARIGLKRKACDPITLCRELGRTPLTLSVVMKPP